MSLLYMSETLAAECISHERIFKTATSLVLLWDRTESFWILNLRMKLAKFLLSSFLELIFKISLQVLFFLNSRLFSITFL